MDLSEELLRRAIERYQIPPEIAAAYRKCPRHLFVKRSYTMEEMYGDHPLEIYSDEEFISTISQPSFVLLMLKMLDLKPGQKVLEIGAGSGWNAALMGELVGPTGKVVSLEIVPALAEETATNLKDLGIENVEIVLTDGAFGHKTEAPYDRGIFTAGASDLPRSFHEQIKDGGKLLFVFKLSSQDLLILLEKKDDHFESVEYIDCQFVPLKGKSTLCEPRTG